MSNKKAPYIDPATTYVISDTHFGHRNIVDFSARPENHEEVMVIEWQNIVPDTATVLHLGDLSYRNNAYFKNVISPKLTGARKLLVKGNHDKQRKSFYNVSGFKLIWPFEMTYRINKELWKVSFSHYPLVNGPIHPRTVHIHGHIHNSGYGGIDTPYTPFALGQINVSVEQVHYRPVNLKRLLDGYILGCY